MSGSRESPVLLLCSDLVFASRITAAAGPLNRPVELVASAVEAARRLSSKHYGLVLIDLSTPGLAVTELLAALTVEPRPRVVAFGPHVQTGLLESARQAGCDTVLPRSRFVSALPGILAASTPEPHAGSAGV